MVETKGVLWEKNFVEPGEQMLYKIIALKDGNYLAAGTGSDVNAYYCFLMKFDANGNVWPRAGR